MMKKHIIALCLSAEHFGVQTVRVENVQTRNSHPTAKGMTQICDAIIDALPKVL